MRCRRRSSVALFGFRGGGQQGGQQGSEQGFAPASGVVHEFEEGKIVGQLLLRDAPVRPQPGAQQRPNTFHGVNRSSPIRPVEESYRIEMTRSALERSSLHRGWTRDLCGRDFRWWLLRQIEFEATEKEFQVRFGLGVAGQEQLAAIAGGDLDVDHLDRGEFLEGATRCQTGGEAVQAPAKGDVQAVG